MSKANSYDGFKTANEGRPIKTMFRGRLVSNPMLQRILRQDALLASKNGDYAVADYAEAMADALQKLEE